LVDDSFRQAELMRRRHRRVPPPRSSFAGFRFPREVIVLAVRWYLRYGLSYRDVEELLAERGIIVDRSSLVHTPRYELGKCIWERTVNPSADAFQGSNP
jgi:transposase-like protein